MFPLSPTVHAYRKGNPVVSRAPESRDQDEAKCTHHGNGLGRELTLLFPILMGIGQLSAARPGRR